MAEATTPKLGYMQFVPYFLHKDQEPTIDLISKMEEAFPVKWDFIGIGGWGSTYSVQDKVLFKNGDGDRLWIIFDYDRGIAKGMLELAKEDREFRGTAIIPKADVQSDDINTIAGGLLAGTEKVLNDIWNRYSKVA